MIVLQTRYEERLGERFKHLLSRASFVDFSAFRGKHYLDLYLNQDSVTGTELQEIAAICNVPDSNLTVGVEEHYTLEDRISHATLTVTVQLNTGC